jgi:hypothetical protein
VPLQLAFRGAASLLPIKKTRIRHEPPAADPAGSLFVLTLLSHRSLRPVTLRKQWRIFIRLEMKAGGSLKPVGKKIK